MTEFREMIGKGYIMKLIGERICKRRICRIWIEAGACMRYFIFVSSSYKGSSTNKHVLS